MLFDTDMFIWVQRGHKQAALKIEHAALRYLSVQTYMELLQGAKNKDQHRQIREFLDAFNFITLPLTENIGHRASIYIEEYALSNGLYSGDALIAATAVENNLPLVTSKGKHFRFIKDLTVSLFKP